MNRVSDDQTHKGLSNSDADYIHSMIVELHRMAKKGGLTFLAHLLEMAMLEAGKVARTNRATKVGRPGFS